MIWTLVLAASAAAPLPDGVQLALVPSAAEYRIGEPVWLTLVVDNGSGQSLSAGDGPCTPETRGDQLRVEVRRGDAAVPDPHIASVFPTMGAVPRGPAIGGLVAAGETGRLTVDLNRFAWLDAPGTYTVRLFHPLGLDPGETPTDFPLVRDPIDPEPDDPRWVSAEVTVRAPTSDELQAVVGTRTTQRALGPDGMPDLLDGLGHARFVPLLENAAKGGQPSADPDALDAIDALALCPCTEATDALLRVRALREAPQERQRIDAALLERIPRPATPKAKSPSLTTHAEPEAIARERAALLAQKRWFADQSWSEAHTERLREVAQAAVAQEEPSWDGERAWAHSVLRRLEPTGPATTPR